MKTIIRILKWILASFLIIPILYTIVALVLSTITIKRKTANTNFNNTIYLNTNGVHLDIVMPIKNLNNFVLHDLKYTKNDKFLAFGWGEEDFYINTPTWQDLTFKNAFKALFLKNSTLVHISRYKRKRLDWVAIKISDAELKKLNNYFLNTFKTGKNNSKTILKNKSYSLRDNFYKATGSYSCFKTCNSWVNKGFKESGLKACFWTPFDFGLLNKYK